MTDLKSQDVSFHKDNKSFNERPDLQLIQFKSINPFRFWNLWTDSLPDKCQNKCIDIEEKHSFKKHIKSKNPVIFRFSVNSPEAGKSSLMSAHNANVGLHHTIQGGPNEWAQTSSSQMHTISKSPSQSGHGSWPPPPPPIEQWQSLCSNLEIFWNSFSTSEKD